MNINSGSCKFIKSIFHDPFQGELFIDYNTRIFPEHKDENIFFSFIGLVLVANFPRFSNFLEEDILSNLNLSNDFISVNIDSSDKARTHATRFLLGGELANECFDYAVQPPGIYFPSSPINIANITALLKEDYQDRDEITD